MTNLKQKKTCCLVGNVCLSSNKVSGFFILFYIIFMYFIINRLFLKYNFWLNPLFQTGGHHGADENIWKC